jgi:hypothetical protein
MDGDEKLSREITVGDESAGAGIVDGEGGGSRSGAEIWELNEKVRFLVESGVAVGLS